MADKPNNDEVIDYDVDSLMAFITALDEVIAGFETPAKNVKAVADTFHDETSKHTNKGEVSPVFAPLGKAVDIAIGKIGTNLDGLVEHLTRDRARLQATLDAAIAADTEGAHSIRNTDTPSQVV